MSKKKQAPSLSGWIQVVVSLTIAVGVTTGTGHVVTSPRPPTMCAQLRVFSRGPS